MKQRVIALLAAVCCAALFAGGCASNEAVKPDAPAVATVSPAAVSKAQSSKPETPPAPVQQPYFKKEENKIEPAKSAAAPDSALAASKAVTVDLETVYFDFDKSELRQDSRNVLSRNAETLLKSKKNAKVKIEGHCDERGSAEYNLALGERRAKSVQQYLMTLGVQPDRLSVISYGKEKPAVQGNDDAAWAKNRRAEFVIEK